MSEPFKNYKRKLRWKSTMRKVSAHGLIPCPNCGGDIQHAGGTHGAGNYWYCADCGKTWPDNDQAMQELHPENVNPVHCPKCQSQMHWRSNTSLSGGPWGLYPEGAWECDNQRCWHMMTPGEMVPDTYQDPDAPGDFTLPEGFS